MSVTTKSHTMAFPSLDNEARYAIPTSAAAYHLSLKPQTMRIWACKETGPLRPIRHTGNRLLWRTDDIRKLLGMACPPVGREDAK